MPANSLASQIERLMGPTWGPPGSCRSQMGPMLAPCTLLSGTSSSSTTSADPMVPPDPTCLRTWSLCHLRRLIKWAYCAKLTSNVWEICNEDLITYLWQLFVITAERQSWYIKCIKRKMAGARRVLFVKHPRVQGNDGVKIRAKQGFWCYHSPWTRGCFTNNAQAARSLFPLEHETSKLPIFSLQVMRYRSGWTATRLCQQLSIDPSKA